MGPDLVTEKEAEQQEAQARVKVRTAEDRDRAPLMVKEAVAGVSLGSVVRAVGKAPDRVQARRQEAVAGILARVVVDKEAPTRTQVVTVAGRPAMALHLGRVMVKALVKAMAVVRAQMGARVVEMEWAKAAEEVVDRDSLPSLSFTVHKRCASWCKNSCPYEGKELVSNIKVFTRNKNNYKSTIAR